MNKLVENYSLQHLNTFGVDAQAAYFYSFSDIEKMRLFLKTFRFVRPHTDKIILAGGSNYLFRKDFRGLVIQPRIKGIKVVNETNSDVLIKVGAGEVWDDFVAYAVAHNWGGIENLSLIPGWVGASPVQNIGAYGVEVKDAITEVETVNIDTAKTSIFTNRDCKFAYRSSIFKTDIKNSHIICSVTFKLQKNPELITNYDSVAEELEKYPGKNLQTMRRAIIAIRERKLPDHKKLGNAGSFFKNPVITGSKAQKLKEKFPEMPVYPADGDKRKIAAGWLIEQCGWKGKRQGNVGIYDKQALVVVNYGGATGQEIFSFANQIRVSVYEKFGIMLETEVNVQ